MSQARAENFSKDRRFLKSAAACGGLAVAGGFAPVWAAETPLLSVGSRTLDVNGKPAKVFSITGPGGKQGLLAGEGDMFAGMLHNASSYPLALHWHGQVLAPNVQDRARPGVKPLEAGASESVAFALTPGTHWMHSHSLTEQQLLAAPMIAREKNADDVQNVIVMLHDFSFRSPEEILAGLGGASALNMRGMRTSDMRAPMHGGHHMRMGMGMMMGMTHANDVAYDAYLANDRTLRDPEVVRVDKGGLVRLRIINGGTATAFFISTGALKSSCIAVDGSPCKPTEAAAYPLAQGQRIDLLVEIPCEGGAFPVIAQVEADRRRTGVILATAGGAVTRIEETAADPAPYTDLAFEASLRAAKPLSERRPSRAYMLMLGEEAGYRWTINGRMHGEHEAFEVRLGERVEMTFINPSSMMHPMHLHGHHFQVVGIGGRRFAGPVRDTVIVPAHNPVTIAFDAGLKGDWFLHCHHLYHMATGMMTELRIVSPFGAAVHHHSRCDCGPC